MLGKDLLKPEYKMDKVVAFCGLSCGKCRAYKATKNNDNMQRLKTAEVWRQYGHLFKPEEINCHGCTSKEKLSFDYCNVCEVRKCGLEKGVKNCASCNYACHKQVKFSYGCLS
jgi:hypothetical protein